jgi:hypothetical protein
LIIQSVLISSSGGRVDLRVKRSDLPSGERSTRHQDHLGDQGRLSPVFFHQPGVSTSHIHQSSGDGQGSKRFLHSHIVFRAVQPEGRFKNGARDFDIIFEYPPVSDLFDAVFSTLDEAIRPSGAIVFTVWLSKGMLRSSTSKISRTRTSRMMSREQGRISWGSRRSVI